MNEVQAIWDNHNKNFQVMYQILWNDVVETGAEASDSKSIIDCSRRSCVRACYAFIEGVAIRSEALASLGRIIRGDKDIPKEQLDRMMSTTIRQVPENRYNAEYRDKRGFCQRVKDSFKALSGATGHPFDLSTCNREWGDFQTAIKIRDRLTHPHVAEDLRIANEDLVLVLKCTTWFHNMFSDVILGKEKKVV